VLIRPLPSHNARPAHLSLNAFDWYSVIIEIINELEMPHLKILNLVYGLYNRAPDLTSDLPPQQHGTSHVQLLRIYYSNAEF
jgi:hypothetical protein